MILKYLYIRIPVFVFRLMGRNRKKPILLIIGGNLFIDYRHIDGALYSMPATRTTIAQYLYREKLIGTGSILRLIGHGIDQEYLFIFASDHQRDWKPVIETDSLKTPIINDTKTI